jgi:hypothetical protein
MDLCLYSKEVLRIIHAKWDCALKQIMDAKKFPNQEPSPLHLELQTAYMNNSMLQELFI